MNPIDKINQAAASLPWWKAPIISIYGNKYGVFDIAIVVLIIIAGFWIAGNFKQFLNSSKMKKIFHNDSTRTLLGSFGRYTIILITFLVAFETMGISLSSLAVIAGALSLGIGFGLQNIVNNLVSGIILMMERSVKIGDIIELDASTIGKVVDIRLRSTIITTFDNIEIVVPNSELVQNRVVNRTMTSFVRRLIMPFGVAYGTSVEEVKKVVLDAVYASGLNFVTKEEQKPAVRMMAMGASSVDFELLVHIDQSKTDAPTPSDFLIVIYNALNQAKISIPFPQLDVHIQKNN